MKHWKRILWAATCLICLMLFGLMSHGDNQLIAMLTPQLAADRWETEGKPYAMASVFLPAEQAISPDFIGEMYLNVENALTDGGVTSENYPWYYAASYMTEGTLYHEGAYSTVELTAIGGDFFRIHPMELLSGWYMDKDDVMRDAIILDRQAAWELFYSWNAAGQYVELNGYTYIVAAVVDTEGGKYNELAAGATKRAWVLSDSPALADSEAGYTCIEMVLPQPIDGFAVSTLKSALNGAISENAQITDNSGRFSLKNRWNTLRNAATWSVSDGGIDYPYWENAAKLTENHLAIRLIPEAILLAIPSISLLVLLLWLNHKRTWGFRSIRYVVEIALDQKREKRYYAALNNTPSNKIPGFANQSKLSTGFDTNGENNGSPLKR